MFDGDISDNAVALRSRDVLPVASPKPRAPAAEKPAEKKPEPKPEAAKPEADKGAAKPEDNRPFWRRRPILTVSLLGGDRDRRGGRICLVGQWLAFRDHRRRVHRRAPVRRSRPKSPATSSPCR